MGEKTPAGDADAPGELLRACAWGTDVEPVRIGGKDVEPPCCIRGGGTRPEPHRTGPGATGTDSDPLGMPRANGGCTCHEFAAGLAGMLLCRCTGEKPLRTADAASKPQGTGPGGSSMVPGGEGVVAMGSGTGMLTCLCTGDSVRGRIGSWTCIDVGDASWLLCR